jgi:hypothetical protein
MDGRNRHGCLSADDGLADVLDSRVPFGLEIETSQGAATVQMRTDLDKTRNQVSAPECA